MLVTLTSLLWVVGWASTLVYLEYCRRAATMPAHSDYYSALWWTVTAAGVLFMTQGWAWE